MIQLFRKLTDRIRATNRLYAMRHYHVEYIITFKDEVAHYFAIEILAYSERDARKRIAEDIKIKVHQVKKA
jgi:hypothetical protein